LKIIFIILDGVGVGELPDANLYNDQGSNTLGNLSENVQSLNLPNLQRFGLGNIIPIKFVPPAAEPLASYGKMAELSKGKDSTTGHWELMGLITKKEFPTYPSGFPKQLLDKFQKVTNYGGCLGNKPASGTVIIQELGEEHQRTGNLIVYTSADSVFQIAAHEETVPLQKLYDICRQTRDEVCVGDYAVGRIIARPFTGKPGNYKRTTNRRDFSLEPAGKILLDILKEKNIPTIGIGKVDDLYAGRGLVKKLHTKSNQQGIRLIIEESNKYVDGFVITNLVDFDQLYGHRNDVVGFAKCLEEFDAAIPKIVETLKVGDWLILTADHGNDPVTPSTDHSREYVPILIYSPNIKSVNIGTRASFADLGKTIGEMFGLNSDARQLDGESFSKIFNSSDIYVGV
jgi:phosphopentomutase